MSYEALKILLVEHDPAFSRYVGEMLSQSRDLAAEMESVSDLTAAIESLSRQRYDAALLDLSVPDGAGLANIPLLRERAPQMPILAVGTAADDILALEAVHGGAQDYLIKSQLNPAWLERAIRYAIERHRMDMTLLEAEEKYHSVFDHLVEGIFQTTPNGRYLMANAALARIYGYASPDDLIHSITDIGRRLYVEDSRRDQFMRLMQQHDTITGFESQIYRKDGSVIWISENCRAIRDTAGTLLYYEGTVEDITLRRSAEENLRNSEALYHSLVETLPQNIFRKDLDERFTFANQHFCRILGHPLYDILGKTDFDFFPRELAEKYQQDDRHVLATGKPYESVEEHQPPGGEKMYVQVVKTPLYGADGNIIGLQGLFWDITQQRLAEEKIRRVNGLLTQSRKELRAKNQQMQDDLKMAGEIQLTMLPQQYPFIAKQAAPSENAFHFTHRYLPSDTVGGDFFAMSALSDTEVGVFICDVAGHSVRSALVTAMVRALVEELKPVATEPGRFLTRLNSDLHAILKHTGSPMLTTAFYLVADARSGEVRYSNAGHPKPLVIRREKGLVEPLAIAGRRSQPVLGLFEQAMYQTSVTQLAPHDMIMLFTDGLYEVQDKANELYSQDLLVKGVERRIQLPAAKLFDELLTEVKRFSADGAFSDDVCLVSVELEGDADGAGNSALHRTETAGA